MKKKPIFINGRTLNFVTGSTLPSFTSGIFDGDCVEEDTELLVSICQALKKMRERGKELKADLGEDRYPNSVAGQKSTWPDFFNDLLKEETITLRKNHLTYIEVIKGCRLKHLRNIQGGCGPNESYYTKSRGF